MFLLLLSFLVAPIVCAEEPDSSNTLTIDAETVVFYRCTNAEFDSLAGTRLFMIDSLSRQFETMKRGVVPFLRKNGIPSATTDRTAFHFVSGETTKRVTRQKFKDLFGVILFAPGRDPEVIRGAPTDVTVIGRVQSYYRPR